MAYNPTNFRTYDIRGIYPKDLDKNFAYRLGLAYADLYPATLRVVVARDVRGSGEELKEGLVMGLLDGGRDVFEVEGIVPVSLMSFAVCHYKLDGGIMVTASHNPPQWNGFKLQLRGAYPVLPEDYKKIQSLMEGSQPPKAPVRGKSQKINPKKDYVDYLTGRIKLEKSLKVVIDSLYNKIKKYGLERNP